MIDRAKIRAAAVALAPRTGMSVDAIEAQMIAMAANDAAPRKPNPPPDRLINRHERRAQASRARRAGR